MSKKVIINAAGQASVEDAKIVDILTTAVSADSAVTGTYGLVQKGLLLVGGMALQSKRKNGTWNPL